MNFDAQAMLMPSQKCMQDELYLIDVSQSVDLDHPHVLDFLREDAAHVNAFFARGGVHTGTVREVFDFVVDPSITSSNIHEALDALIAAASSRPPGFEDGEAAVADKVRLSFAGFPLRRPC